MKYLLLSLLLCFVFFTSCQKNQVHNYVKIKVAASAVPHSELLEFIRKDLNEKGIDLDIIVVDDYNLPNRMLKEKEIDANFFQHIPFLDLQSKEFGYDFKILAKVHIEPLGIYSKKLKKLSDLKKGNLIAIPNDPTNEGRALLLLEYNKLIEMKPQDGLKNTPVNIVNNPLNLKFEEVDSAMLPRILQDVELAVIPTNYALQGGLNPIKDALVLESSSSPYVNVIVIRKEDFNNPQLQTFAELMTSQKMHDHIIEKYNGAIVPAENQ